MTDYLKDPEAIYAKSFATIREEVDFSGLNDDCASVAERMIHACGMVDLISDIRISNGLPSAVKAALAEGGTVLADCEMVRASLISRFLPENTKVVCTLNDPEAANIGRKNGITRSAAAVDLWKRHLNGAVVVIGNAPTALFRLLELLDEGLEKPAAIIAAPVGFVGAAESKAALHADPRDIPYVTVLGRRGGSAIAGAAFNAISSRRT